MRKSLSTILLLVALLAPLTAWSQNARLEALLESQLSTEDRRVEIDGFAGALTAQARMEALRIFDGEGLWLELIGLQLDWDRGALLRGRLEVRELSAARISLPRLPVSTGPDVPDAEASGFRLPELPVAVQIDELSADEIAVGAPVLGSPFIARGALSALLEGGALELEVDAARIDEQPGQGALTLRYDPETEEITVNLRVSEPAGGIAARSLSLPGLPSVRLNVEGSGPLDDFAADLDLATDGTERLVGRTTLNAVGDGRSFEAELSGDIRPLLAPDNAAFFGPSTELVASGRQRADGGLELDMLRITTAELQLQGEGALGPGGAPERLTLTGQIAGSSGDGRVLLPGSDVTVDRADIEARFEAAVSDDWRVGVTARDVEAGGLRAGSLALDGFGQIVPGAGIPFQGRLTLRAEQLEAPEDEALASALGPRAELATDVLAAEGGALRLSNLTFETVHFSADGAADLTPSDGRFALDAELAAVIGDLGPFSGLAGVPLEGQFDADLTATAELPGGAIAVSFDGRSRGVDVGVAQMAPLLAPESTLSVALRRDETGTRIETLRLDNPELQANVSGSVTGQDGALAVSAALREVGLFTDLVSGPLSFEGRLTDLREERALSGSLESGFGLNVTATGALGGVSPALRVTGALARVQRFVPQLAGEGALVAQLDLAGDVPLLDATLEAKPGVRATIAGPLSGPDQAFDIGADIADLAAFVAALPGPARLEARVTDLASDPLLNATLSATPGLTARVVGRPTAPAAVIDISGEAASLGFLSPLLAGRAEVLAQLADPLGRRGLTAGLESAAGLSASLRGALAAPNDQLSIEARVASLGRFVPGLAGGARASARLSNLLSSPSLSATVSTDSGAEANFDGQLGLPGGAVRLTARGTSPLGIAAAFAGGRGLEGQGAFDLALRGAPALSSVAGTISTRGARLFDPVLGITLAPVDADIRLSGGQAAITASAALGGTPIRIEGSAGLQAPFPVSLGVTAVRVPVTFEDVYESEVSSDLRLEGSAGQRLAVSGSVRIEDAEIRIPDTGLGGAEDIPLIRHEGAPAGVQRTLSRAGLSISGVAPAQGVAPVIPLDVTVTTLTPVFVRGRGLDAGFSGSVRITGTARDPIPIGRFDLTRGRLDFLGRRLDLDPDSQIQVAGSLLPRLDVVSNAQVEDITARIGLIGPVDAPELTLSSSPELPEDEILARVLFGKGIETLSAFQVARLVSSIRTLSGSGGAGFLEQTRRSIGVDDLDLRTDETTGEAALAIGQTLNENVYSEVEVGSSGNTTINLNLDLTDTTTLRGSVPSGGETGLGIFWERDY